MSCLYIKEKNVCCLSWIPSPYNVFLYFLEGQMHKDRKLGIMTNVGKNKLVKVILKKHSQNGVILVQTVLVDTLWVHNVWEMFLLFIRFKFLWKKFFLRKLKLIYLSTLPLHYNNCSTPTFLILFKNIVRPIPI